MAALHHVGAAAPGPVTPRSDATRDEAPAGCTAQGFRGQGATDRLILEQPADDRKRVATLTARAALLGLALHEMHDGACMLVGEAGRRSILPSLQAAEALVYGCEHVRAEIGALVGRLVACRGVGHE